MAKPPNDLGLSLGVSISAESTAITNKKRARHSKYALTACYVVAIGWYVDPLLAQPVLPSTAELEQRRAQDRESALRAQQQKTPDVRLPGRTPAETPLLPEAESPCFVINEITFQIAGKAPSSAIRPLASARDALAGPEASDSPAGRCLGAKGINTVIARVQNALVVSGYVTSRVLAEPQDLTTGELKLTLVPGSVGAVRFSDDSDLRGNRWTALPAKPGDILNLRDIEQALENLKRVPTAQADVQIEPAQGPGAQPGQSDLVIRYRQTMPFRALISLDDSGTKATGKYQGGFTFSYDNWWTLNDLFYASLNRDLGGGTQSERGTYGNTVHYSVPIGYWLLVANVSNNRYRQAVAGASQDYLYSGTSSNADVKLSRLVYRDATRKTLLGLRAFQRTSNNYIDDTEVQVQRRVVGGVEASINHRQFAGDATLDSTVAYKRGTGAFGALPAPEEAFGEGTSRLKLITAEATLDAPFTVFDQRLRYTGVLRSQFNRTRLTPQDRFAIGGRYTVRGFDGESSLSSERGWLLRNEVSTALGSGHEAYAGADHARVGGPSSANLAGKSLTGAVVGLRGALSGAQYDFFIGTPLQKPAGLQTASVTAGFSLNYSF